MKASEWFRKRWAYLRWACKVALFRTKNGLQKLYVFFHLEDLLNLFCFFIHRYRVHQFNPIHYKENVRTIAQNASHGWLDTTAEGRLRHLATRKARLWFRLKNALLLGAYQARVVRIVVYTFTTLTLEFNNPFDRLVLKRFLKKKIRLLFKLLDHLFTINGRRWNRNEVRLHIEHYHRNSELQNAVIRAMQQAVRRQPEPEVIRDAKKALAQGLYPLLIKAGCSGSYWMRGTDQRVVGLFKPFDEEIHAPNNPVGPRYRGALGQRKTRRGCRVGEAAHHEVGAFFVDAYFGFGIVPKTYYATFTHQTFFFSHEDPYATRRAQKEKIGSFMEFVEGFIPFGNLPREEYATIPLDELQLLIVLDVILGNTDRNAGNLLVGDEKLAAIDHGLCFPDVAEDFSFWYWSLFEQAKEPLLPAIVDLLKAFPFDDLGWKLHKNCFLPWSVIARMRERVVLFREGILAGLTPAEMEGLMKREYLCPLLDYDKKLPEMAAEQVTLYRKTLK